jgi:ABC-type uncharacterized transport system/Domain of unknown function (DUF4350)
MHARSHTLSILYGAGMLAIYLGERLIGVGTARWVATAAGLALLACATALRALRFQRSADERRSVERMLLGLALCGLLAVLIYFIQSDVPARWLGHPLERTWPRLAVVLAALWPALWLACAAPTLLVEMSYAAVARAPRLELRRIWGALYSGLGLAGALVFAFSVAYVTTQRDKKAYLSYFRTAQPGQATRKLVRTLAEPLQVSLFFPPANDVADQVGGYFDDLRRESPQLQVARYDQAVDVAKAKELGATGNGIVVFSRGARRELLSIGVAIESARDQLANLDREAQKRLLQIARSGRTAYVTVGHGERSFEAAGDTDKRPGVRTLRELLQDQGYQVKILDTAEGLASEIPKDAAAVLVLGPTRPFLAEELAALGRYVGGGGHLLLALDPEAAPAQSGKELAGLAGLDFHPVTLANDQVFGRRTGAKSDRTTILTGLYSSHPSVSTLGRLRAPVAFAGAGYLDAKPGAPGTDFTVRSHPQTWDDQDGNFEFDNPPETRASRNLVAAVQKSPVAGAKEGGRALVLADSDVLTDPLIGHPQLGNALIVIDGIKWLVGDESIIGEIHSEADAPIVHTRKQDVTWFYATIFAGPALVLALGWLVTRRDRKRRRGSRAGAKATTDERRAA